MDLAQDQFRRDGYLVVEDVLDAACLQPMIDELTSEITRRALELVEAGELSQTYEDAGFERQLALIGKETDMAAGLWDAKFIRPAFFNVLVNPALLDVVGALVGPEIIANSVYRLRPKVPGHRKGAVPWHQDAAFLLPVCDKHLLVTAWIPLLDATVENGCLCVIPGAHKSGVFKHERRQSEDGYPYLHIVSEEMPDTLPVHVPMRRGDVLLLTHLTPHASFENNSDVVRWSMDVRYQGASVPACFPPDADFAVRSAKHKVVSDYAAFDKVRRKRHSDHKPRRWGKDS